VDAVCACYRKHHHVPSLRVSLMSSVHLIIDRSGECVSAGYTGRRAILFCSRVHHESSEPVRDRGE
jgi:hypothetical protein